VTLDTRNSFETRGMKLLVRAVSQFIVTWVLEDLFGLSLWILEWKKEKHTEGRRLPLMCHEAQRGEYRCSYAPS